MTVMVEIVLVRVSVSNGVSFVLKVDVSVLIGVFTGSGSGLVGEQAENRNAKVKKAK